MVSRLRHCGWCMVAMLVLAFAGCHQERITRANYDRIEIGMTRAEVEAILGKPQNSYQGVLSWNTNHSHTVISVVLDDRGCVSDKNSDNL